MSFFYALAEGLTELGSGGIFKHSQFTIPNGGQYPGQYLLLPTSFQGMGDSCRKTKSAFTALQATSMKAQAVTASIKREAK